MLELLPLVSAAIPCALLAKLTNYVSARYPHAVTSIGTVGIAIGLFCFIIFIAVLWGFGIDRYLLWLDNRKGKP